MSIYSPLRSLSNFHRKCLFVELSVSFHIVARFLQGTWIAEVRVQGGVGGGNGFIATTMPAQGTLVGRYYENVTDSSEVKSQFIFQVTFYSKRTQQILMFLASLLFAAQAGMLDPLSGNVRPDFIWLAQPNPGLLTFLAVQAGSFIGRAVSIRCFVFGGRGSIHIQ